MSWINNVTQKAKSNSNQKKIQNQFLWILVIAASSIVSYKLYTTSISIENSFIAFGIISILMVLFLLKPVLVKPLLFLWLLLGLLMGEITSTIILAIVYYFMFFPITFMIRIFSKKDLDIPQWHSKKDHKIDYNRLF